MLHDLHVGSSLQSLFGWTLSFILMTCDKYIHLNCFAVKVLINRLQLVLIQLLCHNTKTSSSCSLFSFFSALSYCFIDV